MNIYETASGMPVWAVDRRDNRSERAGGHGAPAWYRYRLARTARRHARRTLDESGASIRQFTQRLYAGERAYFTLRYYRTLAKLAARAH